MNISIKYNLEKYERQKTDIDPAEISFFEINSQQKNNKKKGMESELTRRRAKVTSVSQ